MTPPLAAPEIQPAFAMTTLNGFFRSPVFAAVLILSAGAFAAEPPVARPLTHEDFDAWRGIYTPVVSRDGRWLAYSYMPQDGDGDLVVRELATEIGRAHV